MRVILHTREERKKCTLAAIRDHPAFIFTPEKDHGIDAGSLFLHPQGTPLTLKDRDRELVLCDATWKDFTKLLRRDPILKVLEKRSIMGFVTAYPRKGKHFPHPQNHLASIEVIIAVGLILDIPVYSKLLDDYHFKNEFMKRNGIEPDGGSYRMRTADQ